MGTISEWRTSEPDMHRFLIALALLSGLTLAACGADDTVDAVPSDAPSGTPPTTEGETPEPTVTGAPAYDPAASEPPPVNVTRGRFTLALDAWAYCWTPVGGEDGICADGAPAAVLEILPEDGPITVSFPADFTFSAQVFDPAYETVIGEAAVTEVGDGWEITPTNDSTAVIELFGKGPEGDVIVSFVIE